MNKKILFGLLIIVLIVLPLFSACKQTTSTTPVQSTTSTAKTSTTSAVTSTTTAARANWWDKFGEPEYGGSLLMRLNSLNLDIDPVTTWGGLYANYGDFLWNGDWTLDRSVWSFQTAFAPDDCWTGCLAETWEMTDPVTLTVHLRQGVHWQNKAPVNGREFTAYDVQEHYDRILGTGSGYTAPHPFHFSRFGFMDKAVAIDNYTVAFKFKVPTASGFIGLAEQAGQNWIEAPEVAKIEGGFKDWQNAIGTGPWILTDFVAGSSTTYEKNPDYWGYDERYPQNKLPYADEVKMVVIADVSTAQAAMRTNKIFILSDLFWTQAQTLEETNPELQKISVPSPGQGIIMTADVEPFSDIQVRKALQLTIDRAAIAQSHYGGKVAGNACGIVSPLLKGYDYPYADWPQTIKDEYSYNPEKAKQLLNEAGYPDGFSTNCVIGSNLDTELAQIIKAYFKDINVEMELRAMDPVAFGDFSRAKKQDQLLWTGAACARVFPPKMCISGFYSTDMANYGKVKDPQYDAICDKFAASTTAEESKLAVQDAVKYALGQHWILVVVPQANFTFWQPYLKGFSGETVQNGSYVFARLWIDQD